MTLPYLPGWWDAISQNATRFAQQLPQSVEPGRVADKRFKELVQQNPMIMQQFANMPMEQREAMAQAMGMSTTPQSLMSLPESPQVAAQRRMSDFMTTATPEQLELMTAGALGTKTKTQLERESKEFDVTGRLNDLKIESLTRDNDIQKILSAEKKRLLQDLEVARLQNPTIDVRGLMNKLVRGQIGQEDLAPLQVLQADHGATLQSLIDFEKLRQQTAGQLMLRGAANQDDMTRLMISATESARKAYDDASSVLKSVVAGNKIAGVSIERARKVDPEFAARYDDALRMQEDARRRYEMYAPIVAKKFGIEMPSLGGDVVPPPGDAGAAPSVPPVPGTETPEQRKERLRRIALMQEGGR
jgi:hypothetical protein